MRKTLERSPAWEMQRHIWLLMGPVGELRSAAPIEVNSCAGERSLGTGAGLWGLWQSAQRAGQRGIARVQNLGPFRPQTYKKCTEEEEKMDEVNVLLSKVLE